MEDIVDEARAEYAGFYIPLISLYSFDLFRISSSDRFVDTKLVNLSFWFFYSDSSSSFGTFVLKDAQERCENEKKICIFRFENSPFSDTWT